MAGYRNTRTQSSDDQEHRYPELEDPIRRRFYSSQETHQGHHHHQHNNTAPRPSVHIQPRNNPAHYNLQQQQQQTQRPVYHGQDHSSSTSYTHNRRHHQQQQQQCPTIPTPEGEQDLPLPQQNQTRHQSLREIGLTPSQITQELGTIGIAGSINRYMAETASGGTVYARQRETELVGVAGGAASVDLRRQPWSQNINDYGGAEEEEGRGGTREERESWETPGMWEKHADAHTYGRRH